MQGKNDHFWAEVELNVENYNNVHYSVGFQNK